MDAVKFVEERRRMFAVTGENPKYSLFNMTTCAEDVVKEVEEWSAAHPRKTRQSEFLKRWPAARLDERGVLAILPCLMNPIQYRTPEGTCATGMMCMDCRKKYWGQEVE